MKVLRYGLVSLALLLVIMTAADRFFTLDDEYTKRDVKVLAPTSVETMLPAIETPGMIEISHIPLEPLTGTEDVPIYPNARLIEGKSSGLFDKVGGGEFRFASPDKAEVVISFYKRELVKRGWKDDTLYDPLQERQLSLLDFSWTNSVKEVPIRRYLALSVAGRPSSSEIWIRIERWPDPEYVPAYPGAENIHSEWREDATTGIVDQRVTTYVAKASTSEIEAFYRDAMIQHGWALAGSRAPNNLFFKYRHDLSCPPSETGHMPLCGTGSLVDVYFTSDATDMIKVEVRVGGNEIRAAKKGE